VCYFSNRHTPILDGLLNVVNLGIILGIIILILKNMILFKKLFSLTFSFILFFMLMPYAQAETLAERLSGKILLQVEDNGEAWYVNPDNKERYFLGRPANAFQLMRDLSLGISNKDYDAWQGTAPARLKGKIVLKVEDLGKAYYISPEDSKLHYLGRPADAFQVMREQGLGITNLSLGTVPVASGYDISDTIISTPNIPVPPAPPAPPTPPEVPVEETCVASGEESDNCEDGIDNDCDELIDMDDDDCVVEGTEVSGKIETDTTWTLANSPYLVIDSIEIVKNKTLTIEPGVEIKIYKSDGIADLGGISFIVSGTIKAEGTEEKTIKFSGKKSAGEKGDWGAIEVVNGGRLEFNHVIIKDANTGIFAVNGANTVVYNSLIENNKTGLYINSSATIEYNTINNNNTGVIMANKTESARDNGDYKNFNWLLNFNRNTVSENTGTEIDSAGIKFIDINSSAYQFNVEYNNVSANTNGLVYVDTSIYSGMNVQNNNIVDSLEYAVYLNTTGADVIVENNWWGNDVTTNIDEMIYDYFDVATNLAQVDYRPYKLVAVDVN
jgi:hypothetical protein